MHGMFAASSTERATATMLWSPVSRTVTSSSGSASSIFGGGLSTRSTSQSPHRMKPGRYSSPHFGQNMIPVPLRRPENLAEMMAHMFHVIAHEVLEGRRLLLRNGIPGDLVQVVACARLLPHVGRRRGHHPRKMQVELSPEVHEIRPRRR